MPFVDGGGGYPTVLYHSYNYLASSYNFSDYFDLSGPVSGGGSPVIITNITSALNPDFALNVNAGVIVRLINSVRPDFSTSNTVNWTNTSGPFVVTSTINPDFSFSSTPAAHYSITSPLTPDFSASTQAIRIRVVTSAISPDFSSSLSYVKNIVLNVGINPDFAFSSSPYAHYSISIGMNPEFSLPRPHHGHKRVNIRFDKSYFVRQQVAQNISIILVGSFAN